MSNSDKTIEYSIYIATSSEMLWEALTKNDFRKKWWRGHYVKTDWKEGSSINSYFPNGALEATGKILKVDPPRKLSYTGRLEFTDEYGKDPRHNYF